jgi:hypothetical protein
MIRTIICDIWSEISIFKGETNVAAELQFYLSRYRLFGIQKIQNTAVK